MFDGPIRLPFAVGLAFLLLILFAWSIWRERRILGRRDAVLFWVLRTLALATAIWMLMSPANRRVETATTRRAIALVTDVSGSMATVDAEGTADDFRWAISRNTNQGSTQLADRSLAAIGIAQRRLSEAADALRQRRPESEAVTAAVAANVAIERAHRHLQTLAGTPTVSAQERNIARRLAETLGTAEFAEFDRLSDALDKGRSPSQRGWRESLPDLEQRLSGLRSTVRELARQVADDEAQRLSASVNESLSALRTQHRLQRVTNLLEQLDKDVLVSIRDKAEITTCVFDQDLRTMPADQPVAAGLSATLKGDDRSGDDRSGDDRTGSPVGTDLAAVFEQLQQQREEQALAAVFMFTDAGHNQGPNPREVAATLAETPVYMVPIGNPQHVRDIILRSVSAPGVAMRNDDIVIEANLQAHDCAGEVCVVNLMQDGEIVDFREVVLDSDFVSRSVRFEQRVPEVGTRKLHVSIVPISGELTEDNNYDEVTVNVTRSDIKVLLADDMPRWEYRYLAQLFRRDSKVECDELLFHPRMIATGHRAESKTLPITVDDWDLYDVVLLGDLPPERFPVAAQESLVEYLERRGGTVVLIAGLEAMPHLYDDHPLEEILPVTRISDPPPAPRGYAFHVTDEGRSHHALLIGETEETTRVAWDFVNRYSPLHQLSDWRQPRPGATTLIAGVPRQVEDERRAAAQSAFLCWQPIGRGRVVYLSGPDTYRLRFLRGDRLHYRFWGQLLRWAVATDLAAGSDFVRVRTNKSRYDAGETVEVAVRLTDAAGGPVTTDRLELRVTSGSEARSVPMSAAPNLPGEYVAEIRALPAGVYRAEPIGPTVEALQADGTDDAGSASFAILADLPRELEDTRSDRALAQQIADVTGGQIVPPTAIEEILELTDLDPIVSERVERRPLWLEWKYLLLVFGCLQTEWVIRKWRGLS